MTTSTYAAEIQAVSGHTLAELIEIQAGRPPQPVVEAPPPAPVRAADLHGAAYDAAKKKAIAGGYTPAPAVAEPESTLDFDNQTPEQQNMVLKRALAAIGSHLSGPNKSKSVKDMSEDEYRKAKRAVSRGTGR